MMPDPALVVLESLKRKFTSANSVPVKRAVILRAEWEFLDAEIRRLREEVSALEPHLAAHRAVVRELAEKVQKVKKEFATQWPRSPFEILLWDLFEMLQHSVVIAALAHPLVKQAREEEE